MFGSIWSKKIILVKFSLREVRLTQVRFTNHLSDSLLLDIFGFNLKLPHIDIYRETSELFCSQVLESA